MTNAVDDDSWLDISSASKLTNERARAPTMQRNALGGTDRVWACDGEYVYFRRNKAHAGTLQRHKRFTDAGDYTHVETQDDVEIYKLGPTSPFKRQPVSLAESQFNTVRRFAILAVCAGDYGLFIDCLEELSSRLKGQYHEAFAMQLYEDHLVHIFKMIELRRGPAQNAIDRGVQAVRRARGAGRNAVMVMPPKAQLVLG